MSSGRKVRQRASLGIGGRWVSVHDGGDGWKMDSAW